MVFTNFVSNINEKIVSGGEVVFPVPDHGLMGLLEAGLLKLKCRKGRVITLLPFCKRRSVKIGQRAYHVYSL